MARRISMSKSDKINNALAMPYTPCPRKRGSHVPRIDLTEFIRKMHVERRARA